MKRRMHKYFILSLAFLPLLAQEAGPQETSSGAELGITQLMPSHDFLYRSGRSYDNRAFEDWLYPDILTRGPYQNYYGPLGDYVFRGFDVFSWHETRTTENRGNVEGSQLIKTGNYRSVFDANLVASETHLNWAARLLMANEIPTGLTPLTMSLAGFNGMRLDIQTRRLNLSFLGSRPTDPVTRELQQGAYDSQWRKRNSDLLFGGHGEVQIGALTLGATGINYHLFDSRQPLFELKGQVQATQPLPKWVVARFADDSPEDQRGGAVVSEVRLRVNGEPRPDLQPFFVRINIRNPTAVGRTSRITGVFTPTRYPDQDTRFADVFYLMDHLRGEDVGRSVNVELLERFTEVLPAAAAKRADGEHMVLAYFDLSEEAYVQSVQVEALVGNDYKMDVKGIYQSKTRGNYEDFFAVETLSGVRRSKGNVQDQANLDWVRLDSGVFTGRTTLGLNGKWEVPGARVQWEYARGVAFRQYPDGQPEFRSVGETDGIRTWKGLRSDRSDEAYYLTAQWRRGWLEAGGEVFSIGPDYEDPILMEDNDDHDRWPDGLARATDVGTMLGDPGADPDGIFPGKDQDNDGVPDTNRNGNDIPDYDEAFLLFEVEPDEYVYGRDWNHNGVVDHRENDFRLDYPYTPDQRGYHLFGRWHLPGGLALGLGQQRARGIAFGGHNHSTYTYLTFEAERSYWGRVFAETLIQRVEDDIEDTYQTYEEVLRSAEAANRGFAPRGGVYYISRAVKDPLDYRDSMDWQYYVEGEWTPILGVRLAGNARYELNRQREVIFADGTGQGADRLKLTTSVLKAEYVWTPATRWQITGQWKGLWLRRIRESASVPLVDLWTSIPFFKVRYDITARTSFQLGFQGLPGLPLKERDLADRRNDMEEEVRVIQLSNHSPYFGYQISMNLGMRVFRRRFDDPDRSADEEDVTSAFMRVFLGWDE